MTICEKHWAKRLAEYEAAAKAVRDFDEGEGKRVNEADDRERERLDATYGSLELARANPIGKAAFEATWAATRRAECMADNLRDIHLSALFALMVTPAPDWASVLFKLQEGAANKYDDLTERPESALVSIRRDIEALASIQTSSRSK